MNSNKLNALRSPLRRLVHLQTLTPRTDINRVSPLLTVAKDANEYKLKEGVVYHNFQCQQNTYLPHNETMSSCLRHLATGTEIWYLDRPDTNRTFAISLRTPPTDAKGTPLILQQLVLCGSQKFAALNQLQNRSMATQLLAKTGPDYTIFASTTNSEADYVNLQQLYLDAVFRPRLNELDLLQQGWRLEHLNIHDADSDLVLKGKVYERVKEYSANPHHRHLLQRILAQLLPDHAYGRLVQDLPLASLEDVQKYHANYYHPSNARIFCSGSLDIMKTLELLDGEYLGKVERLDTEFSSVPSHAQWTAPRSVELSIPMDVDRFNAEQQHQLAVAVRLSDVIDVQETFELEVLTQLLLNGAGAPLQQSLQQAGLSTGRLGRLSGHHSNTKDTFFALLLEGLRADEGELMKQVFDETLDELSTKGFDQRQVAAVLAGLELAQRNQAGNVGRFMLDKSLAIWNHGGDYVASLDASGQLSKLRQSLQANGNYLQEKLKQYFVRNPHRVDVNLVPDEEHESKAQLAESEWLLQQLEKMDNEALQRTYEKGLELQEKMEQQHQQQPTDALPALNVEHVQQARQRPNIMELSLQNVRLQICRLDAKEPIYLKCKFNLNALSEEDVKLIPLLCHVINAMAVGEQDQPEFDLKQRSKCAPIQFSYKLIENLFHGQTYQLSMVMSTYALEENVGDMFNLCAELLLNYRLDQTDRLQLLVEDYLRDLKDQIKRSPQSQVLLSSAALVSNASEVQHQVAGLDQLEHVQQLLQDQRIPYVQKRLQSIGATIFHRANIRVALSCSEQSQEKVLQKCDRFLLLFKVHPKAPIDKDLNLFPTSWEINLLPSSVHHHELDLPFSHIAKSFYCEPFFHSDHPTLRVISSFLSGKYIPSDQQSIYPTFSRIGYDGIFQLYTRRESFPEPSMDIFNNTYQWLQASKNLLTDQALFEAKCGVLKMMDRVPAPAELGDDYFLSCLAHDCYIRYRERVLAVTPADIWRVVDKYLKNDSKYMGKAVVGPKMNTESERK